MTVVMALSLLAGVPAHTPYSPGRVPPAGSKKCPAEELSCLKQHPIRSDGLHSFNNGDMGLSVVFPLGALVCIGRSGDAPRGFYAWLGVPTSCSERVPKNLPGYFGIYASYNALEWTSPKQAFLSCKPVSAGLSKRLRGTNLGFRGHRSAICQRKIKGGIELTVTALAGPRCDGPPAVDYDAFLGTTWRRFETDLKLFETFVAKAKIGNPDVRC